MKNRWLPFGTGAGRLRLFVFPNAGGGPSMFRRWRGALGRDIDVCPVLLPGRENRLRETAIDRIDDLVAALEQGLAPAMDRPFAFLGHSMGTALAFELAHRLRARGASQPRVLALAGRRAPHRTSHHDPVHDQPDAVLIEKLRELGGTPEEIFDSEELMTLLLPMIRADFTLVETYRPDLARPLLDIPMLVYGGEEDEDAPREELVAWQELTEETLRVTVMPGGHFFLHDDPSAFLGGLFNDLTQFIP